MACNCETILVQCQQINGCNPAVQQSTKAQQVQQPDADEVVRQD